jgi:hypothetical protein
LAKVRIDRSLKEGGSLTRIERGGFERGILRGRVQAYKLSIRLNAYFGESLVNVAGNQRF